MTKFAETLEQVCVEAVEAGEMTKDLALLVSRDAPFLHTEEFLDALDAPPAIEDGLTGTAVGVRASNKHAPRALRPARARPARVRRR